MYVIILKKFNIRDWEKVGNIIYQILSSTYFHLISLVYNVFLMIDISSILYIYIALLVRHFKICMYRNLLYVILDINSTDINSYLRLYIT